MWWTEFVQPGACPYHTTAVQSTRTPTVQPGHEDVHMCTGLDLRQLIRSADSYHISVWKPRTMQELTLHPMVCLCYAFNKALLLIPFHNENHNMICWPIVTEIHGRITSLDQRTRRKPTYRQVTYSLQHHIIPISLLCWQYWTTWTTDAGDVANMAAPHIRSHSYYIAPYSRSSFKPWTEIYLITSPCFFKSKLKQWPLLLKLSIMTIMGSLPITGVTENLFLWYRNPVDVKCYVIVIWLRLLL